MAKNKNNRNNRKRTKRRGTRRRKVPGKAVADVCAVTDPFCHHAEGAYAPEGTNRFTIPFTQRAVASYASGAGGFAMVAVGCGFSDKLIYADTASSLTATAFTTTTGTIPDFVNEARVVSAGVKWWCPLAATAAGGILAVVPIQDYNDADWATGISYTSLLNTPGVRTMPLRSEGQYIFSKTDSVATHFGEASASLADNNSWDGVVLIAIGPASSVLLNVETIYHLEGTVNSSEGIALGSKGQSPNPLAVSASHSKNFFGAFEGPAQAIGKQLKDMATQYTASALRAGVSYGVSTLGNALVPGLGTAASMGGNIIMDLD